MINDNNSQLDSLVLNEPTGQELMKVAPKKWKMMLLVWVSIYPLLNIFFPLLTPYISDFSLPIRLLIMTIIIVPIMSVILASLQKRFFFWLRR
ncbi:MULTISPECIES: hypothetical protein [Marinomonas]|uniref:Uncharacterized protein n=1 Tax=Marinomonas rhodophyticola TaxID=2992803 RepID=A0ABT3KJC5_9GAMM|nr:hypothetical protein [Marinomonas sp. KJ51-3]MCW4630637.1 hypothetical protein [Marinomonas sp. KJ51-3]